MVTPRQLLARVGPGLLLGLLLAAPSMASPQADAPPPRAPAPAPLPQTIWVEAPAPGLHSLTTRPRATPPRWSGEKIDVSLRDADLVEVLRSFAKIGRFHLVLDPAVRGKVTVELRDVPWDAALVVILRTHGLAAEIDGRIVSVSPLAS